MNKTAVIFTEHKEGKRFRLSIGIAVLQTSDGFRRRDGEAGSTALR